MSFDEHRYGYLVVLRNLVPVQQVEEFNTRYQGIDRVPPVLNYPPEGIEDPLVFGDFTDENGLIQSFEDAQTVLDLFLPTYAEDELEIIYVATDRAPSRPDGEFLGWDVADVGAPFVSIVRYLRMDEPFMAACLKQLNPNGLFSNIEQTEAYLEEYLHSDLREYPVWMECLVVWSVERLNLTQS